MASSTTSSELDGRLEEVLGHLPISGTVEYGTGQMIYGPDDRSKSIYLVITGNVGISQIAEDGTEVLLEIVRPAELFGESAFLDLSARSEQATAIEKAKLMTWAISDLEDLVMKQPRLAVALLQILAQRNAEFVRRIESLSIDTIERRLARSLIHFSERLGTPEEDGSVRMMPLTHVVLSRYVGTSREMVNHYMNRFRRQGYVSYSRQGIFLYRDALKASIS
jgi:CRP/FNR family cyclic AMP-dependent transcriptional regulator